jgi:hypothetical protein
LEEREFRERLNRLREARNRPRNSELLFEDDLWRVVMRLGTEIVCRMTLEEFEAALGEIRPGKRGDQGRH